MRVSLYIKLLPLYIGLAALVASPFYLSYPHTQEVLATARSAEVSLNKNRTPSAISGKPVRIVLANVSIDLPVVTGYYIDARQGWYVSPSAANYAVNTYPVNNSHGTTLIYGHALTYVFGRTSNLKPGDTALIYTDNGHIFKYLYSSESTVEPTDTQIFSDLNTEKPVLKLMTCDGAWSQNRRFMIFNLVEAG
jgi:LPXTG-site transpeptidase (sortase) family protein